MDMRGKLGGQIKTRDELDHRDLPTVTHLVGVKGKRPFQSKRSPTVRVMT
jgi:hypothetical protein